MCCCLLLGHSSDLDCLFKTLDVNLVHFAALCDCIFPNRLECLSSKCLFVYILWPNVYHGYGLVSSSLLPSLFRQQIRRWSWAYCYVTIMKSFYLFLDFNSVKSFRNDDELVLISDHAVHWFDCIKTLIYDAFILKIYLFIYFVFEWLRNALSSSAQKHALTSPSLPHNKL